MIANPPSTAAELRDNLITVMGDELGQYKRPNLPNCPAIWVGRKIPLGYKVITSGVDEPLLPSAELVIGRFPDYQIMARNQHNRGVSEMWRVYLIYHDDRQNPRLACQSIMRSFNVVEFAHLPAGDLNPEQYQFRIEYYNRLRED